MLIFDGEVLPCAADVRHDPMLVFAPGSCGARKRTEPITQYVHHWTGGEGSERGCYRVLRGRGLSVHFFLRADGVIYQYCDPARVVCAHAGAPTNGRSIGIEMQNVGHGRPNLGVPRARIPDTVHGVTRLTSQFTDAQMVAAKALRLAFASLLPISVLPDTDTVPLARRNRHVGDLGHYQISDAKRDPGARFMAAVASWAT